MQTLPPGYNRRLIVLCSFIGTQTMKGICLSVALVFIGCSVCAAEKPSKVIPGHLLNDYTLGGQIPVEAFYVDDTNAGEETHFVFPEKSIASYLKGVKKSFLKIVLMYSRFNGTYGRTEDLLLQPKADWIYFALHKYINTIKNSSVAVFGSAEPYAEVACIELGARHVTTIEYNNLTYMHENISTISKFQFPDLYACNGQYQNSFDVALSISSFDHDGLGRYGDPLDGNGDLKAMARTMSLLKPGGLLFLTVPIGPDVIVFNLLRRYGTIRLPLLLQGWEVVERMFWVEERLTEPQANYRKSYEPVFVLRKPLDATVNVVCIEEPMVADDVPAVGSDGTDEL